MANKSKTQKAKASARRAEKKAAAQRAAENPTPEVEESSEDTPKKSLFSKKDKEKDSKDKQQYQPKKSDPAPKKKRGGLFKFLREVRAEMKRVTWPTRQDVMQWSGVVVVALLFFGIYVAVLDSGIITPLLVAFSGLAGA